MWSVSSRRSNPLADRDDGHPQSELLTLIPAGAETEEGAAPGEDVEGGHDLGQQSGVAIHNPGDEQAERNSLGVGGDETERGVPLEHRFVGAAAAVRHLEVVVHVCERGEPALVGHASRLGQGRRDQLRAWWGGEVPVVQAKVHRLVPLFTPGLPLSRRPDRLLVPTWKRRIGDPRPRGSAQ
jgi:hypothetical protein